MLVKQGKIFYARFMLGGKDTWINTFQTNKEQAKIQHDRLESIFLRERTQKNITHAIVKLAKQLAAKEIEKDNLGGPLADIERMANIEAMAFLDGMLPAPPLRASDLWARYVQSKPELEKSTFETKESRFGMFMRWAGDKDMAVFKQTDARAFLKSLKTEKSQTWNNYISDLSSIWKLSSELKNPWTETLRMKNNVEHKLALSRSEVRQIVDYCEAKNLHFWRFATILSYYTGLRLKSVVYFSRFHLRGDGYISLVPEKTKRSNKKVSIKINPHLQSELDKLPKTSSEYFFPEMIEKYNGKFGRDTVANEFTDILEKTKLYKKGIGFHSLRHTFVTLARDAGIATKDIQAAVGHDSVLLTEDTYYHGVTHSNLDGYPTL